MGQLRVLLNQWKKILSEIESGGGYNNMQNILEESNLNNTTTTDNNNEINYFLNLSNQSHLHDSNKNVSSFDDVLKVTPSESGNVFGM